METVKISMMKDLRVYVTQGVAPDHGESRVFYSRRGEGPFYCWRYEEGLGQWRSARVLSYHLPLKELCTTSWKALPSALQARLDEYYIE